MQNKSIQYTFLFIFVLTAIVTLLGITQYVRIDDFYLKGLYGALLLELIAIVLSAGKQAFAQPCDVEHYKWDIRYPDNLQQNFESLYVKDQNFAQFYEKNKTVEQSKIRDLEQEEIRDGKVARSILDKFLDALFVIKKAGEFAGQVAHGELFIIRQNEKGADFGKGVLVFPREYSPIAFNVRGEPELGRSWRLSFEQPDRYVEYEGRINKWPGATLDVDFTGERKGEWTGALHYSGVYVGKFSLSRT